MAGVNNTTVINNGVAVIEGFLQALNTLHYKKKVCTACISLSITLYTPCTSHPCIYKKIFPDNKIIKKNKKKGKCQQKELKERDIAKEKDTLV